MRAALPLLLILAACAAPAPERSAPQPAVPSAAEDTCGAAPHAALVGQDGTALERVLIMREVRVIRPGDPVTRDLRPQRINFDIGPSGRIDRIFCG